MARIWPVAWTIVAALVYGGCGFPTSTENEFVEQSYEHVRPSWSPDGRTIAFTARISGTLGIYLVDSSGANVRLLRGDDGIGITWSPDSRWVAYSSLGKIWKVRVNGDSLTRLTDGPNDIRPAWSPDGTRIVFMRNEFMILDLNTGTVQTVGMSGSYPQWHPNGRELVYLRASSTGFTGELLYRIETIDLTTRAIRTIILFSSIDEWGFSSLNSPATEIVMSRRNTRGEAQVWKVDLVREAFVQLTADGGDYPAWSPDGTRIVYTRTAKGDGALWTMNSDGTGKRRLTSR